MAPLHRMDSSERRPGARVCGGPHTGLGQGKEGQVIMQRYEEDGMEELGWLVAMLAALGFLFFSLVYFMHWAGWLT